MLRKTLQMFLHAAVWLAAYLLPYFVANGSLSLAVLFQAPGDIVHAVSTALLIAYAYANHYLLVPNLYLRRKYVVYAVLVVSFALIVIKFPTAFRTLEKDGPQREASGGQHHHDRPPPTGFSKPSYNIILFVICTFGSISMRQQRQLLETQKEKVDAELSFLKAQINPHFLFNTLNSIYALSIRKSDDTPKAIIQLSELMRYILKDSNANTVSLDKELSYINNYIALQRRRLGNTVQINYSAPARIINYQVAPLIIMSFVENAFKHGVNPSQDSIISIAIALENKQLKLSVVNNKVTFINHGEAMGIGLKNAASRLEHLYPGKYKLTIENGEKTFSANLILELND